MVAGSCRTQPRVEDILDAQNERESAAAELRDAGGAIGLGQHFLDTVHDHLAVAKHGIDEQAERSLFTADEDCHRFVAVDRFHVVRLQIKQLAERDGVVCLAAERGDVRTLNRFELAWTKFRKFQHVLERQHKMPAGVLEQQAVDDHDRFAQRNTQVERSSLSNFAIDANITVVFANLGSHDVHTHAAAGNVGYLLRRREAGVEDQFDGVLIRKRLGLLGRKNSLLDRLGAELSD